MSFVLKPQSGKEFEMNAWQWRTILELLGTHTVLNEELLKAMGYNGDIEVTEEEAGRIADFLDKFLSAMKSGERLNLDQTTTDKPDDGTFHRDNLEENYSASYEILARFRDFCRSSNGFRVG